MWKLFKTLLLIQASLLCMVGVLAGSLTAADVQPLKLVGKTMGTYYAVVVDSPTVDITGEKLQAAIDTRLQEINRQMSTWDPQSEISQFNASSGTDWFEVSPEFAQVVAEAKRIHELTNGAFDPTVSPLIDLWGFGDGRRREVPSDQQIADAMKLTGMQHIEVRHDPPALKKAITGVQLNLSAIAKGYGVDSVAELLVEMGQPSFIVDIGGESKAGNAKASGQEWRVGIESALADPLLNDRVPPRRIVNLNHAAIATSGDYRNFFEIDGKRYSHAINPTTGRPVEDPPASVSVVADSCMTADAWATALMVMGVERGAQLAEAQGLTVMFQVVAADRTIQDTLTGDFSSDGDQSATQAGVPVAEAETTSSTEPLEATSQPRKLGGSPWVVFAVAAVVFLLAIGGMAVGVIVKNRELKGSCGGLAAMPGNDAKSVCDLCSTPREECMNPELREQMQAAANNARDSQS